MIRMLIVGYAFAIRSERALCRELFPLRVQKSSLQCTFWHGESARISHAAKCSHCGDVSSLTQPRFGGAFFRAGGKASLCQEAYDSIGGRRLSCT
jgi:hypothetical protein